MKKLTLRMFEDEKDYKDLVDWAIAIGQVVPTQICLPGVGAVAEDEDGKKYGCGFLYLSTDTPVAYIEWMYFNPVSSPKEKVITIKEIIGCLEQIAKAEDHPVVFSSSSANGITKIYEKAGWTKAITNMDHLIKIIQD